MLPIRKNDIVSLAQGSGRVLDIIATNLADVYKVEKLDDRQIIYVEARMTHLAKQCFRSQVATYSREVINFLAYTVKIPRSKSV